jgi:hypothetical protein
MLNWSGLYINREAITHDMAMTPYFILLIFLLLEYYAIRWYTDRFGCKFE